MRYQAALRPDTAIDCNVRSDSLGLQAFEEKCKHPCNEEDWNGKDDAKRGEEQKQKTPVAPGVCAGLEEVALEQAIVAAIGLPGNVEDVAKKRYGADEHAYGYIDGHAKEGDVGDATNPGSEWNDE